MTAVTFVIKDKATPLRGGSFGTVTAVLPLSAATGGLHFSAVVASAVCASSAFGSAMRAGGQSFFFVTLFHFLYSPRVLCSPASKERSNT